ncbi:MAG: hypothetical protein IIB02_01325 [Thaumarchaeota archaeon]|nr:hypothetical protein [Nitrososphaerota archaeon]
MTLFKKNQIDGSYHPFLEFLIITSSLIAVFFTIRIVSRIIFMDEWIGSLGLISGILGMILFLSKKEKLGVFGQMFIRQIIKNHKGKRKWIIYIQIILFLFIGISTIFSIHMGNNEYYLLKEQVIDKFQEHGMMIDSNLNLEVIKNISSQLSSKQQISGIVALPLLAIQHFEIFSVVLAVTDQLMGGWVMYFWQVMVIEIIEIAVFIEISKKLFFKNL